MKEFIEFSVVPAGSRLLEISVRAQGDNMTISAGADTVCTFGVPWTPLEFMQEAARRGHPPTQFYLFPSDLGLAASDTVCVAERRAAFYRKWMSIAAEVHEEEKQLKEREIRACEALGASEAGRISKARHMAGRMSFASGQIFGRLSKSCLKAFYSVLERSSTELDPGTVAALSMYVEIAQDASATINFLWPKAVCLCVH